MSLLKRFQQILILSILFLLPFYFIKLKYGWASLNIIEISMLALAIIWFWINRGDWGNWRDWKRYELPAALILAGVVLSTIVNKNYYVGLGIFKGWFVLPMIFAVILHDNLKKDERLLDKIFIALLASGALVSVEGIYYWLSGLLTFDGRLRIFFDSPNQLAMFLAPVFLVGLSFTQHATRNTQHKISWRSLLSAIGLGIISFVLCLTKSVGVGTSLAVVLFLLVLRMSKNRRRIIYTSFALILALAVFFSLSGKKAMETKILDERSSLASRIMIWKSAGLILKDNPLFGIGPVNFQNKYLEYQKYFPPYLEWAVPQPHNLFLAFWLEAGLAGLIGFIWLLAIFFRDNKKAILKNRNLGILCLGIMLYLLLHGLADTTYWRSDLAVIFWTVIAVNLSPFAEKPSFRGGIG